MSESDKWSQRRLRHCKQYGIKKDVASETLRCVPKSSPDATTPIDEDDSRRHYDVAAAGLSVHTARSHSIGISRAISVDRSSPPARECENIIEKRDTVFQMACDGLNSVINGDIFRRMRNGTSSSSRRHTATVSRVPTYISVRDKDRTLLGYCSFPNHGNGGNGANHNNNHRNSRGETTMFTAVAPTPSIQQNGDVETPFLEAIIGGNGSRSRQSKSATPENGETNGNFYLDYHQDQPEEDLYLDDDFAFDVLFFNQTEPQSSIAAAKPKEITPPNGNTGHRIVPEWKEKGGNGAGIEQLKMEEMRKMAGPAVEGKKFNFSLRDPKRGEQGAKLPIYGKFIADPELIKKLKDDSVDFRPYFTYWISTVHVLVLLAMLLNYGIGTDFKSVLFHPLNVIERSGDVMTSSLSAAHIVVWEQNNIWIGPKYTDLVHAGAKYTPCMRRDTKIYDQIRQERETEADSTGCCIGPWGCYQTSQCPKQFAQLHKWVNGTFYERDYSRVVCGQDPRYCVRPRSLYPIPWGINISNWPICEQRARTIPKHAKHMHCQVTGRPCCIQMHGQCRITSQEYCDFVGGYYHPNATLCSQVSCLNEVCGMTPFWRRDVPDQLYRLVTPLFIHAGIIRCAISLSIYLTIMRRFETMIGWKRLSTIFFVSGIGGYLASAVFVPYMPEVGPAGSEGGILGALIVNILYNWDLLLQPGWALSIHLIIAGVLFVLGFLPWIDNWAQVFGFIFGSLMAIVLIPYITIGKNRPSGGKRLPLVIGSLCLTALLFGALFTMFFVYPINLEFLELLNCPIPTKICDQQGLILRNWLPI